MAPHLCLPLAIWSLPILAETPWAWGEPLLSFPTLLHEQWQPYSSISNRKFVQMSPAAHWSSRLKSWVVPTVHALRLVTHSELNLTHCPSGMAGTPQIWQTYKQCTHMLGEFINRALQVLLLKRGDKGASSSQMLTHNPLDGYSYFLVFSFCF